MDPSPTLFFPNLVPLIQHIFTELESKLLSGKNSTHYDNQKDAKPSMHPGDILSNLGIVSTFSQNFCYVDGQYNNNDWKVTQGYLEKEGTKYDAYRVEPPKKKAKNFLASHHFIYYKFLIKEDFDVFLFQDTALKLLQTIKKKVINEGEFLKIDEADVSILEHPKTFFFIPSSKLISVFQEISNGVYGATIFESKNMSIPIKIEIRTYPIGFDCYTPEDFSFGPASHENIYTTIRVMFPI